MDLLKTAHIFEILQNSDTDHLSENDTYDNKSNTTCDSDNTDLSCSSYSPRSKNNDTDQSDDDNLNKQPLDKTLVTKKVDTNDVLSNETNSDPYSDTDNESDCESSDNSVQTFKDTIYCINCGINGHLYKKCNEPITSYGVILISLNISDDLKKRFIDCINSCDNFLKDCNGININESIDIGLFSRVKSCIYFLMIQRKHTLGFIEFIRGRYSIDNIDDISYLFKQMTNEEIHRIKNESFDALWNNLWGKTRNKSNFKNEYMNSNKKFNKLKYGQGGFVNLDYYVEKIDPTWDYAEWGFPKGRRNYLESDIECGIREFKEETGLLNDDFIIFDNIEPITELFIGTNGIPYKHIYYIGIIDTDKPMFVDQSNPFQYQEIGNIEFMSYEECIDIIRPYHLEKKKIVTNLYMAIINILVNILKQDISMV